MSGIKNSKRKYNIGPGKKVLEWNNVRAKLKIQFERWGITSCELRLPGCWINNSLGFAHIDKRRKLKPGELTKVILACQNCHNQVEYASDMREKLSKIIDTRNILLRIRGEVL